MSGYIEMLKWNYKTHSYEPCYIPSHWKVRTYCDDMTEVVNCASCGKEVEFGMTYCSRRIHTVMGFGYAVCAECYEAEFKEEIECIEV